jgi:hypothetical protein
MRRIGPLLALTLATVLVLPQIAAAGAPGVWTAISPPISSSLSQADAVRRSNGELTVEWAHSGGHDVLESAKVSAAGAVTPYVTTDNSWSIITNPGLLYTASNDAVEAWFGAQGMGAPFDGGLFRTVRGGDAAAWSFPSTISNLINPSTSGAYASNNVSLAWSLNQLRVFAVWDQAGSVWVARSTGGSPAANQVLCEGGSNANYPNVATDPLGTGSSVLATWASISNTSPGVKIAAINPTTGAPTTTWTLPGSSTMFSGSPSFDIMMQRTPLVAMPGGTFAVAYPIGYPTHKTVRVWRATTGGPVASADVATGSSRKDAVSVAVEPGTSRLWVTWAENTGSKAYIRARRSDSAGNLYGAVVSAAIPSGTSYVQSICTEGNTGKLDVVALLQSASGYRHYHTQMLPGLTVAVAPAHIHTKSRKTISIRVLDVKSPVKSAKVKLGSKSVYTNSKGYASFKVGPYKKATTLKFSVSKSGYTSTSLSYSVKR